MRIWFVNHYALPPGSTGGPTRHLGLARALRDRGHEVTVVASVFDHHSRRDHRLRGDAWWQIEDIDGVCYVWLDTPPYQSTARRALNMAVFGWRVARLARRLPLEDPDVVIGSSPHLFTPLAAKWVAWRRHAKFVTEVRDIWPQSMIDLGELSPRHPLILVLSLLERYLYRTSDELITVLPHAQDHFLAHGGRIEHLHVIPNGVAISDPPAERVDHDGFVAVYAGTMGLANGLDLAIDAARILHERGRHDIAIRLVGAGPEHDHLAERARHLPNITVEPAVRSDEVPGILAAADAGLLILRDSPVFRWGISPTKLFDYMAAGLPVVVSVRSPGDPASDRDAAVRAVPGDAGSLASALERLADMSPTERSAMGQRGRAAAQAHSFDTLAERYALAIDGH